MSNIDPQNVWGGSQSSQKPVEDLPERPLPKPIQQESTQRWTPAIPEELRENPVANEETTKKLVITIGNVLLPLIGLSIIIGGIFVLVSFLISFYGSAN